MPLPLLAAIVIGALTAGYFLYGKLIARQYRLDDTRRCPAEEFNDGDDYVPAKPFYLLGQHFSAIAAAGPIVGPIAACMAFGWLPCVLWIGLGVIFIGAVHDFSALVASVRHKAQSVAGIVRENLGTRAWLAILAFIWIALVYVIVAFADVTAGTFAGQIEELEGKDVAFSKGGAVAFASTAYLLLAVVMGFIQKKLSPPLWLVTLIFVPATLGVVWLGTKASTLLVFPHGSWVGIIMAYCFVASLLPVWVLLQPRGYLGGFVLYIALAVGVVGLFFGGFTIQQPAFKGWGAGKTPDDHLFPFLFVTIACGACSGFHGLVCSGTTSKQISKESDCKPVGYGAMLLEAFVALIALGTILIAANPKGGPGAIYGDGMGEFLTVIIGKQHKAFATVFGAMVFSTFVFDTLDVATRLGRIILQELTNRKGKAAAAVATLIMTGVPFVLLAASKAGSWRAYWTLFGTSNQLLAGLTFLGITVWLKRTGRPYWFTLWPMVFVLTITVWSLVVQGVAAFREKLGFNPVTINGVTAVLLGALTALLLVESVAALRRPSEARPA
ncbi:MAG TPA: carbon starvation protein A [Planctomycetota bacterium]